MRAVETADVLTLRGTALRGQCVYRGFGPGACAVTTKAIRAELEALAAEGDVSVGLDEDSKPRKELR